MKHIIALLLFLVCLTSYATSQGLPTATPEDVGMSSERLERINPVMQRYVDEGKLAGVLTMVARRGKVVHLETFGKMDIAKDKPMTEDTIFRLDVPVVFKVIRDTGHVSDTDMLRTFNMGVGLALVCAPEMVEACSKHLADHDCRSYPIGRIVRGSKRVAYSGTIAW